MTLDESFDAVRRALSPIPVEGIVYEYDTAIRENVARVYVADNVFLDLVNNNEAKLRLASHVSGLTIYPLPATWIGKPIEPDIGEPS